MKKNILVMMITLSLFSGLCYTHIALAATTDTSDDYADIFGDTGDTTTNDDNTSVASNDATSNQTTGTVYMKGETLDGDIFKLSILTKDMTTPVLGIAFHLGYQKDKLAFLKYEPGDFLERGGDPFYLIKNVIESDEVVAGETLRRNDSFPLGEGKILDIYFQVLSGKTFDFEFKNGIVSTLDSVRQDIDQIAWENFTFDPNPTTKVATNENLKSSTFNIGKLNLNQILTALAVLITAAISSFLLISVIKKHEFKAKRSREIVNLINA